MPCDNVAGALFDLDEFKLGDCHRGCGVVRYHCLQPQHVIFSCITHDALCTGVIPLTRDLPDSNGRHSPGLSIRRDRMTDDALPLRKRSRVFMMHMRAQKRLFTRRLLKLRDTR